MSFSNNGSRRHFLFKSSGLCLFSKKIRFIYIKQKLAGRVDTFEDIIKNIEVNSMKFLKPMSPTQSGSKSFGIIFFSCKYLNMTVAF